MGNIGWISTRIKLTPEMLDNLSAKAVAAFQGHVTAQRYSGVQQWFLRSEGQTVIEFWIEPSKRKIGFSMPRGPAWKWWVYARFENEIALAINGTISNEGVKEKWKGVPEKYDRFDFYVKSMNGDGQKLALYELPKWIVDGFTES